jgi:predicted nucleotidyltransferase
LFEPVFEALDRAGVRFVVVGGVAVVLHGHARLTADLDLVVDLAPDAAERAIAALDEMGLRPAVPVDPTQFADPQTRAMWVAERGMRVFTMRDPEDPLRQVDLFADEPIPFDELWQRATVVRVGGIDVRVAAIPDLIRLKELADRPTDRDDIEHLRRILEASGDEDT